MATRTTLLLAVAASMLATTACLAGGGTAEAELTAADALSVATSAAVAGRISDPALARLAASGAMEAAAGVTDAGDVAEVRRLARTPGGRPLDALYLVGQIDVGQRRILAREATLRTEGDPAARAASETALASARERLRALAAVRDAGWPAARPRP